jgi:hypothetical protein
MAITIDGTAGTIAGLVAGGLPDASVVDADIATGITSSKLSGALPAVSGASLTNLPVGPDNTPACHAWLSTDQTGIAHTVKTKILFNTVGFDTHSAYDTTNYRFTPGVAGYYWIYSCFRFDFYATTAANHLYTHKTGVSLKQIGMSQQSDEGAENRQSSTVVYLNTTDYIEIYARQDTGSTRFINGGTLTNWSPKMEPDGVSAQLFCMKVAGVS